MGKINFQSPLFPQKSKKNRTIARNLGQIVLIGNRTIARTVLIESVLLEDPLYYRGGGSCLKLGSQKGGGKFLKFIGKLWEN